MKDMKNLPAVPDLFYRDEWKGWQDFLDSQYPYDWMKIEIIQFNYNGMGDAIALCDDRITYIHSVDLNIILFGDQWGVKHFEVISSGPGSGFIFKPAQRLEVQEPKKKSKPKPKKAKARINKTKKKVKRN